MFEIRQRGSTVGREVISGLTVFMAMSYILFVQVGLLGGIDANGDKVPDMNPDGVMMATCLSAAAASILMGLLANYPVALAPGMGENFFFAMTMVPALAAMGFGAGWQMALALTVISGTIFLLLSVVGFRSRVLNAIPDALKSGIASGIGLFIAVIGFHYGNLVVKAPGGGLIQFPGFRENPVGLLTLGGLAITMTLMAFRVHGAILLGIFASAAIALATGMISWCGSPVSWPGGLGETAGGFLPGLEGVWKAIWSHRGLEILAFTFILLFMDLFDTVGTLIGVSKRAGLIRDGKLPKAERALAADAAGTIIGGVLGTSTVTSYIESITGVQAGARTGLAAIVAGACMALAVFFTPLARMIGGGIEIAAGEYKYPLIAPALIIVGSMMIRTLRDLDWDDVTESLPAFLTMITMPLAYSISDGIAIGFVSYAFGKTITGRFRQCPVVVYVFAVLFAAQYLVRVFLIP